MISLNMKQRKSDWILLSMCICNEYQIRFIFPSAVEFHIKIVSVMTLKHHSSMDCALHILTINHWNRHLAQWFDVRIERVQKHILYKYYATVYLNKWVRLHFIIHYLFNFSLIKCIIIVVVTTCFLPFVSVFFSPFTLELLLFLK